MAMLATVIFANPLTERLAAFMRGIGIDVHAAKDFVPYPHMLRWLC